jgi:hypothetical protein
MGWRMNKRMARHDESLEEEEEWTTTLDPWIDDWLAGWLVGARGRRASKAGGRRLTHQLTDANVGSRSHAVGGEARVDILRKRLRDRVQWEEITRRRTSRRHWTCVMLLGRRCAGQNAQKATNVD